MEENNVLSNQESKNISYKFLCLEMSYKDFMNKFFSNKSLRDYYDKLSRDLLKANPEKTVFDPKHYQSFEEKMTIFWKNSGSNFSTRARIYTNIYALECIFNNNVPYNPKYSDLALFAINAIPEYAEGDEVMEYMETEIISKLPVNLSEAQKVKLCKAQIKEHFHIEGNKFPRWAQSGEWPLINGKPGKYVDRRKDGDKVEFVFEDPETKEQRIVVQYY